MVETAKIIADGNLHLHVALLDDYYPSGVSARLEIRWYRNDDFNFHYKEEQRNRTWQYRWDRHPNVHNTRDHFHPPPAASRTDVEDAQWPSDHRNVCQLIFDDIEERIETLWEKYE